MISSAAAHFYIQKAVLLTVHVAFVHQQDVFSKYINII